MEAEITLCFVLFVHFWTENRVDSIRVADFIHPGNALALLMSDARHWKLKNYVPLSVGGIPHVIYVPGRTTSHFG